MQLTYAVTDPTPGSGVPGLHVVQGSGSTTSTFLTPASGTVTLAGTCSAVEFWGEDVAGNTSTPHCLLPDTVKPVFTTVPPAAINTPCTVPAGLNLAPRRRPTTAAAPHGHEQRAREVPAGDDDRHLDGAGRGGQHRDQDQDRQRRPRRHASCCPTGSNVIMGTSNNDTLNGTAGADCIFGLGAQDTIRGNGGNDAISGGDGDDDIGAGRATTGWRAAPGRTPCAAKTATTPCSGGDGDDQLWGGNNDDRFMGGQGQDHIYGEAGTTTSRAAPARHPERWDRQRLPPRRHGA